MQTSAHRPPEEEASRVPDPAPYPTEAPRASAAEGMSTAQSPVRGQRSNDDDSNDRLPPREARTDPGRGTGEMGSEGS